jgi:DNA-binding MarR family transcriptional regulator
MTTLDPAASAASVAGRGQRDLTDALVQASFAVMAVLNRVSAEHDLSLTQLRVLAILRDRRGRISELADYLGLDKSTVSGLVDRAEKRGLLRRAVDVYLTPDGARLAGQAADQVARALAAMTGQLGPAESRRLTALLERMLVAR